ncbi:MAG TPA: hypothetical protein VFP87_14725 [Chitinophagaceae bacterium]|nr:hypothetical protein [Chitinophagaceae bacterium]
MKTTSSFLIILSLAGLSVQGQQAFHAEPAIQPTTFFEANSVTVNRMPFAAARSTVGSRFLFPNWVKATVVNNAGASFNEGLFNFDKMGQNLYMQIPDTLAVLHVDKHQLKSISLTDGNVTYLLEKVPALDTNNFYNVLVQGSKYSLYSLTKTKFIPSDYQSNGIVTTGNLYDEYKDEISYYVVFPDGSAHEASLKKKSVKNLFSAEKTKVDEFFKAFSEAAFDQKMFSLLVQNLNQ